MEARWQIGETANRFQVMGLVPAVPGEETLYTYREQRGDAAVLARAKGTFYPLVELPDADKRPLRAGPVFQVSADRSGRLLSRVKEFVQRWRLWEMLAPTKIIHTPTPPLPIVAFAWHPYQARFAVALADQTLRLFDIATGEWSPLAVRHEFQHGIQCMEWRPLAGNSIAVGCSHGVCVWSISLSPENSATWMSYIRLPCQGPVTSLSWSPSGRHLAYASCADSAIVIWDMATDEATPIRRVGGGVSLLRWSPSGYFLFSATVTGLFRVWETKTWTAETWKSSAGPCATVCWSRDGKTLLIAYREQPILHAVQFGKEPPFTGAWFVQHGCEDLSAFEVPYRGGKTESVCGPVVDMAWDDTGERLALVFAESEVVGLVATKRHPFLTCTPIGFIRGPLHRGGPIYPAFRPNAPCGGALLSMCWTDGCVSFVPLYFKPEEEIVR